PAAAARGHAHPRIHDGRAGGDRGGGGAACGGVSDDDFMTAKPTKAEILAAAGKTLPDVIAPNLRVLFCGINPGLYTAAVQQHFGRPGNRFWPVLHGAGFTPRLFHPSEQRALLPLGYGITNLVARATAAAAELSDDELAAGARILERKVRR